MRTTLLVTFAALVVGTGCRQFRTGAKVPSLVANAPPAAAQYPAVESLPNHEIDAEEWSWVTGRTRAASAVAGQITGTTLCDLHGPTPAINQAEVDRIKSYLHTLWQAPTAPPFTGGTISVKPTGASTPLQSVAFDCSGATPHFTVNGVGIKPDYLFTVYDATSRFTLAVQGVSVADGNVLGFTIELAIEPTTRVVTANVLSSSVYAANIKPYFRVPFGVGYLEGIIAASTVATYLVEASSNPPQGVYLENFGDTVAVSRFFTK